MDAFRHNLRLMSKEMDTDFPARLRAAAAHAKVDFQPTAIGKFVGVNKQTAATWIAGSLPRSEKIFEVADAFGVDPRWFATGEGQMLTKPGVDAGLQPHEEDLVSRYRVADPRWQLSLRLLSYVATEEQHEVAGDVNIVLARIFGKRPREIRPVSNKAVEKAYGMAPHVAQRRREKERK